MRPRQIDSGYVDSLFPEPLEQSKAPVVEVPAKESIAVFLNGKWYSDGKMLWDCSDCLCPSCANNGASCTDCKGPEKCAKHNNKMGLCPDFRWKDGKEQDCMHGCLCIGCALVGQECKECVGPIRCSKPTMKCKKYVGGDMEDIGDDTEDSYTPSTPIPAMGRFRT